MRLGPWLLACALLAACGGGSSRPCDTADDCPAGSTCTSSRCQAITCVDDASCPRGSICDDQACRAGCRSAQDCTDQAPLCDTGDGTPGTCVGCITEDDCLPGYECAANQCVQACRGDSNCDSGHCDTAARRCIECTEDGHCGGGEVCDDRECVPGCSDDSACPVGTPRCDPDRGDEGRCVECRGDADCGDRATCTSDGTCASPPTRALDVLFIIDDSAQMIGLQEQLAGAFPRFVTALEAAAGSRPDLHLGVVTTTIGIPGFDTPDCRQTGFDGALQASRGTTPCLQSGLFLRDVAVPGGGRDMNYAGTLESTFSCLSRRGQDGCGFEQPLEALRRALDGSVAANAGFLRPDAALAVVILGDEDDCSASDVQLYSPDNVATLGTRSSFRCFEYGVRCIPDAPRQAGAKTRCAPRDDSPYIEPVATYVQFLRGLRRSDRLSVSVIAGPVEPIVVNVVPSTSELHLGHSCVITATDGTAVPAVRLAEFAKGFARGAFINACEALDDVMTRAGAEAAALLE